MRLNVSAGITGLVSLLCGFNLFGFANPPSCEPTVAEHEALKQADFPDLQGQARTAAQKARLAEMLQANPDDLFFHLRYLQLYRPETEAERTALIERYKDLADSKPADPGFQYLYASALVGKDTPQAIAIGKKLIASQPPFPRAFLLLEGIYEWGKYQDHDKSREQLAHYFDACPGSLDSSALSRLQHNADQAMAAKLAPILRQRLEGATDPNFLEDWPRVWNLQFKAHPVTEHDQVRKVVAADVAHIEKEYPKPTLELLEVLKDGYTLAENRTAADAQDIKLVKEFPDTPKARRIEAENWSKAHPYPDSPDKARIENYWRMELLHDGEILKTKPHDESALISRFMAYSKLPDSSPQQVQMSAEAMLAEWNREQDIFYSPPLQFQVAQAYVKKSIGADRVPGLVEQGLAANAKMAGIPSDNDSVNWRKSEQEGANYMTEESALILEDAAKQLHKPEIAADAVAKAEALHLDKPGRQSAQFEVKAKWAELQGHNLDAFLFFRQALDLRPTSEKPKDDDQLAANVDRLWKELGGTEASHALLAGSKPLAASNEDGRWEKPTDAIKDWQLTDLNGQPWKLKSLEGKVLLVNFWASWCGPCKAEHPHLQKLYDQLKNDPHIQIVSLNIDDELGEVAPYIKEHKYTFPVLLAKDYADEMSIDSIPRNWIVDSQGKWLWQQIGFGSEERWEAEMTQKLKNTR